ncbi:MAG: peptidoglycan DD-metalloendopeptidase family protein, partial [Mariprofundus sp.]|nr:peptidoglycan DD-metalloendopeptidase family protein [Mariprofundus sp.]
MPNTLKYHSSEADHKNTARSRLSPHWYPVLGALAGFFFILLFIGGAGQDARARISSEHIEWLAAELNPVRQADAPQVRISRVRTGDNSMTALERLGFGNKASFNIVHAANTSYQLKDIHIGHVFKRTDSSNGIDVDYNIDATKYLRVHQDKDQNNWQASIQQRQVMSRLRVATGSIDGSLFSAAEQAGIDQRTTMNLVDIFAWDIDFARDMRRGDTFRIVYEEHFDDQGNMLESSIFAAEFVNQGKTFQAVRSQDGKGKTDYYTPSGKGLQKTYLKAPVKFSRISSRFSTKRKHPVLGYTRAHRGVDYACRSGTPIHALGSGKIMFRGWKGGYGRFILIRHNN